MVVGIIWIVVFAGAISCFYTWPRFREQRLIRVHINQQLTEKRRVKTKAVPAAAAQLYHIKVRADLIDWPGKHTFYSTWVSIKHLVRLKGSVDTSASYVVRTYAPCQEHWSEDMPVLVLYSPKTRTWACAIFGDNSQIVDHEGARVPGEEPTSFLGRLPLGPLAR